ncbi:uncharacterized protein [Diadema antillarum]|uniref:uncharacterized protein n=1 Tax=Diadema antillarum TaxID=105358 RepID=UPI003A875571
MIQCETLKAMIDHTAIPDLDISSPRSLPHLSLPASDDSQLPRPHETGDEDEDEEVVLVNDLHDVLLDFATTSPDMACFTISSAINNSGLPTAFSLEELSPDLSAACFPVNGRFVPFVTN